MKVLVTGGAGFIGSFIVEEIIKLGWEPIVVDDLSTGNLSFVPKNTPFYNIDIRSQSLEQVFRMHNPQVVIHQAAQVSVEFSSRQPFTDCEINTLGTLNILKLCAKYKVSKLVYASSAAVYGIAKEVPITENHSVLPISFYGLSKYSAEQYIHLYQQLYGLNYTILRYSNVYGMRQNMHSEAGVVSIFVNKAIKEQQLTVYGDGNQTRDFVFVRDVAKANIQAVTYMGNETFNISTNQPVALNELIAVLQQSLSQPLEIIYADPRAGDIKDSYLSYARAKQLLKWEPQIAFETGINETVEYYQSLVRN
ncbi:NAD-dependent epimerase/dehydratase family protein [Paenisporosarcina indica]|uniref:NAD-dependent epimerase/dehydratase family protein n=1 Tax=Paenisporosarcina indica TaxID=650093 RepID=UPI00094FEAD2|nr:NAD-dependent epimerase/dehydratase family protein [Paenisporosarcina indica]